MSKLLLIIVILFFTKPVFASGAGKEFLKFLETPYLSGLSDYWQLVIGGAAAIFLFVLVITSQLVRRRGIERKRKTGKYE